MKRLQKTRNLLKALIEKEHRLDIGEPFTDSDILEVSKELDLFEKNYSSYRLINLIIIIAGLVALFIYG